MITIFSKISNWLDGLVADWVKLYLYDGRAYHRTIKSAYAASSMFWLCVIGIIVVVILWLK